MNRRDSKLLDMLAIEGAIVTIDAMGLSAGNRREDSWTEGRLHPRAERQPGTLRKDVEVLAAEQKANGFKDTTISRHETVDGDHGRIETRTTTVIHDVAWLRERHDWPGCRASSWSRAYAEIGERIERETRFYSLHYVVGECSWAIRPRSLGGGE